MEEPTRAEYEALNHVVEFCKALHPGVCAACPFYDRTNNKCGLGDPHSWTANLATETEFEKVYSDLTEAVKDGIKTDVVNHPPHYETGNYECIDVMLETQGTQAVKNFCICNGFKYIYRNQLKNGVEDIRKAIWYLNKYVELCEYDQTSK